MQSPRFSAILFPVFCLLFACGTHPFRSSSPIKPLFENTIQTRQNLVFRFSHPVVKPEEIGSWDTTRFLHFSPSVSGQFRWSAIDELVFSPDKAFDFATEYSVSPAPGLIAKFPEAGKQETIRFSTPQLGIEKGEAIWKTDASGMMWIGLHLYLNQAVLPDELMPGMEVLIEGKKVMAEPESHFPSPVVSLKISGSEFALLRKNLGLKVNLRPEKVSANIKKWLKSPVEFQAELPSSSEMSVYGLDVKYAENGENYLLVRLSQVPADTSPSAFVQIPGVEKVQVRSHPAGLEVRGSFAGNSSLELTLKKGLRGLTGAALQKDQTLGFQIGEREGRIAFASSQALYLPKAGNRMVAVNIRSVSEVSVQVLQIFPNNILHRDQSYTAFYDDYGYEAGYGSSNGTLRDDFGTLISTRNFKVNQLLRDGNSCLIPMDMNPLPGQKGIFLVKIADLEKRYISDSRMISVTDIGLMAKQTKEQIWIKSMTLSSNKPRSGVMVTVLGRNNQPLFSGQTNAGGEITIARSKLSALGSVPAMILAETADDFTYLDFSQTALETSRFPVDGVLSSASGWQAVILSPRNLYQPGEKISMQVLLRDRKLSAIPDAPLWVKVFSPMGKEVRVMKLNTGRFGAAFFDFVLPVYLATGTYSVQLTGSNQEELARLSIHNESFDPLPLDIVAQAVPERISFGKDWPVSLQVDNMFGLPAGKRPVKASLSWSSEPFAPGGYEKFSFSAFSPNSGDTPVLNTEGETNEKGQVNLMLPAAQIPANQGLVRVNSRIQVFDEAQVPVYKSLSTQMCTQKFLLGLHVPNNDLVFKKLSKIEMVSLNADGKPVPGRAYLEIGQRTYRTVMEIVPGSKGNYRYVNRDEYKSLFSGWIEIPEGKAVFPFLPLKEGNYEISLKTDPNSASFVRESYFVYEGQMEQMQQEELSTEGNVEIFCDAKNLKPGDKAKIRFVCPFPGTLSISFEQNRILKTTSLETSGKEAFMEIPVSSEMAPNFYISAVLTRPMDQSAGQNPLTVAYGYENIGVTLEEKELKTEIRAPGKSGSGRKIPVDISLGGSEEAGIALAMVDEGILKITRYKMANPFEYFHRKQALGVASFSMFGKIFSAVSVSKGMPGGDGMYMKAAGEMDNKQNVSSFLVSEKPGKKPEDGFSVIKTGNTKVYRAYLEVPAGFAGKIRLMTATYSDRKVGYSEKWITVSDDITIKASLPDYLYPGDRYEGSVSYFNTSKREISCVPELRISGISAQKANWPAQLRLKPGEVSRLHFILTAGQEAETQVKLLASESGNKYIYSKKFSVKAPNWIVRHEVSGELAPGQSATFSRPAFLSSQNLKAGIELSKNPFTRFLPAIQDLVRYPYGCLEQTVSSAFPLIYLPSEWLDQNKISNPDKPGGKWQKNAFVNEAIRKIAGFQLESGGFSYWPGWSEHEYFSAYATHFLLEARRAGFEVDARLLNKALEFTLNLSREKSMCRYRGRSAEGKKITIEKLDPAVSYSLYVNALAGKVNRAALLQWKSQPEKLTQFGRFFISCALMEAGDADGFKALLPARWEQPLLIDSKISRYGESNSGDWVNTATQEEAFVLAALAGIWPAHPLAKLLASRLNNRIMTGSDQMSTHELGMAVVALGKLMNANAQKDSRFFASLGQQVLMKNEEGSKKLSLWTEPLLLRNENKTGNLYYFIQAQGFSSGEKAADADAGIQLRRSFFNAQGQAVDPAQMRVHDLVVVKLSLKSLTGGEVKQVVIADVTPSCLRVENKRLNLESDFRLPAPASNPDYLDIRRDRVHLFCTAAKEEKHYFYSARVTARGKFRWASCEAQAMYQPAIFSRSGEKMIQVSSVHSAQMAKR